MTPDEITQTVVQALTLAGLTDPFALDRSFTNLGGDSVAAALIIQQIRARTGRRIPLSMFFSSQSLNTVVCEIHRAISVPSAVQC